MRSLDLLQSERVQAATTPGRIGDASAAGRGAPVSITARVPQYVTYSGATATVHKRLMFGLSNYGLGSELL